MRKSAIVLGMFLIVGGRQLAFAQRDLPKVEVFGGFSYLPAGGEDFPRENSYGFQFSACGNVNRWFGVVADVGGQYKKVTDLGPGFPGVTANTSVYEYMAGPRFSLRRDRYTAFFHGLAGGAKGDSGIAGFSDSSFAFGVGGGLDVHLGDRISVRAIQMDYIGSFVDILEDNVRLGFGIVIRLGRF